MGPVTSHPGRRAVRAALLLGLLALPLASCGLFRPTSPEAGSGDTTLLADYSDPESCLAYMAFGIESKDNVGLTAYMGALADGATDGVGFHAFFDAAVWNAYTGERPADWDRSYEETQFYPAFIALRSESYDMRWLPDEQHPLDETINGDSVILHRKYEVYALSANESLLIAVGYADLYFARVSASRWAVTRWHDRVDPDVGVNPTDELWRTFGYWRLNARTGG